MPSNGLHLKQQVETSRVPLSGEPCAEARVAVGEEGAPIVRSPWCVCFFLGNAWLLRDGGLQGGAVNKRGSGLCVSGRVF